MQKRAPNSIVSASSKSCSGTRVRTEGVRRGFAGRYTHHCVSPCYTNVSRCVSVSFSLNIFVSHSVLSHSPYASLFFSFHSMCLTLVLCQSRYASLSFSLTRVASLTHFLSLTFCRSLLISLSLTHTNTHLYPHFHVQLPEQPLKHSKHMSGPKLQRKIV